MNKFLSTLLISILVTSQVYGGLPPTSVQGQSDTSAQTKFNFQVPYNQKTDLGGIKALFETGNENLLVNGNFENISYSTGHTITTASGAVDTSNFNSGKQSAKITFSASTGGISQDVTPTITMTNVLMQASCMVNTSLSTIQLCSRVGGIDLNCSNVPSSGTWQPVTSQFIGPSSGSIGYDVKTTSSTTGTMNVDQCYVGKAVNTSMLAQAQSLGVSRWASGLSQWIIATTSTTYQSFPAYSGAAPTFSAGATIVAPSTKLLETIVPSAPPGTYYVVFNGMVQSEVGAKSENAAIFDSNGTSGGDNSNGPGTGYLSSIPVVVGTFTYTTTQTNLAFDVRARSVNNTGNTIAGEGDLAGNDSTIQVFYFPNSQQAGYNPGSSPANWSGYQTITSGCSTTSATYTDPSTCTGIALTQSTNRNFPTMTTAASSLPGITGTLPMANSNYRVCASGTVTSTLAATASIDMVDSNGNTLNKGVSVTNSALGDGSYSLCGIEPYTTGAVTIKLQLATSASTSAFTNGTASGSSAISWTIDEIDTFQNMPFFLGSNGPGTASYPLVSNGSTTGATYQQLDLSGIGVTGILPNAKTTATSANTASAIVARDASGNFNSGTINKVTLTAPATGSTLTIADGKTLTSSNTLTFTGTDGSSVNFGTGGTMARPICISGVASAATSSTSETNLAVCAIPSGIWNANGVIKISAIYKLTGSTSTRNAMIRLSATSGDTSGGTAYVNNTAIASTALSTRYLFDVYNANSTSAQVGFGNNLPGFGGSSVAPATSAFTTGSAITYVNFNASVSNAADSAQVVGYQVELVNP